MGIKERVERRNRNWARMQELMARNADMSAEDKAEYDRLEKELVEDAQAIEAEQRDVERRQRFDDLSRVDRSRDVLPAGDGSQQRQRPTATAEYRAAFDAWVRLGTAELEPEQRSLLRTGASSLSDQERRALGTNIGAAGGFTVPDQFMAELERQLLWYGNVLGVVGRVDTSTGGPLTWPVVNDTTNKGRRIGENQTVTQTDPVFASRTLFAHLYSSDAVLVPLTLLQDNEIGIDALLADLLAERLGRIANEDLTNGSGAGEPEGVLTNVTNGVTAANSGGWTTKMSYDHLVDLEHSVDRSYRSARSAFMMHDLSVAVVRKIKDDEGRPMFTTAAAAGEPDRLMGRPIIVNNDMPVMAANAKSVIFGDFTAGYRARVVKDITLVRATERWIDSMQVGFFAFMRFDGKPTAAGALRSFINAAS